MSNGEYQNPQPSSEQSGKNEGLKSRIHEFLQMVSSYQTKQNKDPEKGWYKIVLNQGDYTLQQAVFLDSMMGVSGVRVKDLDGRNHELRWNPVVLTEYSNKL